MFNHARGTAARRALLCFVLLLRSSGLSTEFCSVFYSFFKNGTGIQIYSSITTVLMFSSVGFESSTPNPDPKPDRFGKFSEWSCIEGLDCDVNHFADAGLGRNTNW